MGKPWILAHRGASGYRPEHTLSAYQMAIDLGADFLEPDIVITADGAIIARHGNELSGTTDVASREELAYRRTTKVVDGKELMGWFTEDFTLDELKTLRAREGLPAVRAANTRYDGRFQILTLDEIIEALVGANARREHQVGLCVEIKHATYFHSIGLPMEQPLLECLERHGMNGPETIVESMDTSSLRWLRPRTKAQLVQLFKAAGQPYDFTAAGDPRTYADLATAAGLREVATYADIIGVEKTMVFPRNARGRSRPESSLVADAHAVGLGLVVWTMGDENRFLPAELRMGRAPAGKGDAISEYERFFDVGVDGVFSDNTDTAVEARNAWLDRQLSPATASESTR